MKKYDIFLFDADGTLYDFDRAEANALRIVFGRYGFEYSESALALYRKINIILWEKYEKGEISLSELKTSRFVRLFDGIGVCHDAENFNAIYLGELGKGAFLNDGAFEICEYMFSRGKKIYIVTNGMQATQKGRIEHSLIRDYVSDFFVSEAVGFQKPQIEYFEHVLRHIPPVGKEKILIIGDSLKADIAGGNNAGIDSCWYNAKGAVNGTDIVPTYEISAFDELRRFIE